MKYIKFFFLGITSALLIFLSFNDWGIYALHLAKHQAGVILNRQTITGVIQNNEFTAHQKQKIELIQRAKQYGKKLYKLDESNSFETYVDLHRDTLGWNITAARPYKLEAVSFHFPFVGRFSYLGFFSETLKDRWVSKFEAEGYDVYVNKIGAYSTLGVFEDPLYSTYLQMDDVSLIRLILHEMSHEKLYFSEDTNFSESLSSFIEVVAARKFYAEILKQPLDPPQKNPANAAQREAKTFMSLIETCRNRLEKLFSGDPPLSTGQISEAKDVIYKNLQIDLAALAARVKYIVIPEEFYKQPMNNAMIIQFHRYRPAGESFQFILDYCRQDIDCWFSTLNKMKHCSAEFRKNFLETFISEIPECAK